MLLSQCRRGYFDKKDYRQGVSDSVIYISPSILPIVPLSGLLIELAVELPHCYTLRVHVVYMYFVESILFSLCQRFGENFQVGTLAATCWSDEHEPVSDLDCIVELKHLCIEARIVLEIEITDRTSYRSK